MSKRIFRQLEKHYYAMLERFMTCPLNDESYDKVATEFRQVRDRYNQAAKERRV